ncbi:MAG TPA: M23 family metallopeptidase [Gemmatimonadales bacterium]|nr:M23 family metallopeptidase [Gemmatimonadales bacterium]
MRKRADRRWTVMMVPHSSGASRAVELSRFVLTSILTFSGLVALALVVLCGAAVVRGIGVTRNREALHERAVLVAEVERIQRELVVLRDTLVAMGDRQQQLRLLAGMSVLDTAVQAAGIGGPVGAWAERDSVMALGADGAQAWADRMDLDGLSRRASILARSIDLAYDSLSNHQTRLIATPSILPARGRISSPFTSERLDPILHIVRRHQGMDVAAPAGATIAAPAAGVVTGARWVEGYGNMVTLDHGYGVVTRFAHCLKILVVPGQRVKRGQAIALVGSTGESTGPHVHYEVWVNGKAVDPKTFVLPEDRIVD